MGDYMNREQLDYWKKQLERTGVLLEHLVENGYDHKTWSDAIGCVRYIEGILLQIDTDATMEELKGGDGNVKD